MSNVYQMEIILSIQRLCHHLSNVSMDMDLDMDFPCLILAI